jgi:RNA polymerase sigma-70 factor (ECF subfamily)
MTSGFGPPTSTTLLSRLRHEPTDQAAWAEFVRRYGPQIYAWCRRWQLQQSDAEEVTQAVLVKLSQKLRTFSYDRAGCFRAYLKTVARYGWCDFLESRRQPGLGAGGSDMLLLLESIEAGNDLVERLNAEFDQEIFEEAQCRVRERVEPHTWEAFRLTALEGHTGAFAAGQLGLKVATVFKAKSKVQQMLREEIAELEDS